MKKKTMSPPADDDSAAERVEKKDFKIEVEAPAFRLVSFVVRGESPYVQFKFSEKVRKGIEDKRNEGSTEKSKKAARPKRDVAAEYDAALHHAKGGGYGIPAGAFRNAMIDVCRVADVKMTVAKMTLFIKPDCYEDDGTGLVRITHGKPRVFESYGRAPKTGALTTPVRGMWDEGWRAKVTIKFDEDTISPQSVANLLHRAGQQVGIGEGRAFSKTSNGCGWGFFGMEQGDSNA